jgi:hypothetical protein
MTVLQLMKHLDKMPPRANVYAKLFGSTYLFPVLVERSDPKTDPEPAVYIVVLGEEPTR